MVHLFPSNICGLGPHVGWVPVHGYSSVGLCNSVGLQLASQLCSSQGDGRGPQRPGKRLECPHRFLLLSNETTHNRNDGGGLRNPRLRLEHQRSCLFLLVKARLMS